MVRYDVKRFNTRYWSIHTEIEENVSLIIKRNHQRTKSYLTLTGVNYKTRLPKTLFKKEGTDSQTVNTNSKLDRKISQKILEKGKKLITETEEQLAGERSLTACYAEGGQLSNYVYCIPTGQHWTMDKYLRFILSPIILEKISNDQERIYESDIKHRQRQTNFFDFYLSATGVFNWLVRGGYHLTLVYLDSLTLNELKDIFYMKQPTFYYGDGLTTEAEMSERLLNCRDTQRWIYPDKHKLFQANGALGWQLVKSKIGWIRNFLPESGLNYSTYVIKDHYAPAYLPAYANVIEINMFQQRWAYCTVRREGKIICHSPLLSLAIVLDAIDDVLEVDVSAKTCKKWIWDRYTLTNFCIRTLRKHFNSGHLACLQSAPPILRQAILGV